MPRRLRVAHSMNSMTTGSPTWLLTRVLGCYGGTTESTLSPWRNQPMTFLTSFFWARGHLPCPQRSAPPTGGTSQKVRINRAHLPFPTNPYNHYENAPSPYLRRLVGRFPYRCLFACRPCGSRRISLAEHRSTQSEPRAKGPRSTEAHERGLGCSQCSHIPNQQHRRSSRQNRPVHHALCQLRIRAETSEQAARQ